MEYEIAEMRLAELERRIRELESAQDDNQGQNAMLPPFVPIPQLNGEVERPWTFACTEDAATGERTGGWSNCQLQIGFACDVRGGIDIPASAWRITGCDKTADGEYYVESDLNAETGKVILSAEVPSSVKFVGRKSYVDYVNSKVYTWVGTVKKGVQTDGIFMVPTIYKFV